MVGFVGRRVAGPAVGLIAAAIIAVYPFMWINDGMLMSESLVVLIAALVLWTAYSFVSEPTTRHAALFGLACGAGALTRTEMALLFPLLLVPLAFLLRNLARRERFRLAVVGCAVGAAMLAPWVLYNLTRFDEPTFTSSSFGSSLSAASCDQTYYGTLIGYYVRCYNEPYREGVDESERDLVLRNDALDYIESHKSRLPLVVAARVGRLWGVFKPGQTTAFDWSIEGRGRVPTWISLFFYYALIPFAVFGLVRMRRQKITILPVVVPIVIASIAAAATFGITRYRAPAEVGLVLAAAVGISAAWTWLRERRRPSKARV